jgi:hypothetical protein
MSGGLGIGSEGYSIGSSRPAQGSVKWNDLAIGSDAHWARMRIALRSDTDGQAKRWLVISGVLCALVFLATIPMPRVDNHLVGSDGTRYYAITRSMVLDRDFDFSNDFGLLGVSARLTPAGLPESPYAIGTAILWIPFFLGAHLISLLLYGAGIPVPLNGVSDIYEASVCLGTIAYATTGFILTFSLARRALQTAITPTLWSVIGLWWATPAIYYLVAEPSMSHGLSIFSVAVFLFVWYPPSANRSLWSWMNIGIAAGLVGLVRWQDGLIALVPLMELLWWLLRGRINPARAAEYLAVFCLTMLLVLSPQFLMWKAVYGTVLTIPQGNDFFSWANPQVLPTLFSTHHGLISWHPIFLLAFLGIFPLWKRNRVMALVTLFVCVAELYINSATTSWWAADAFGGRRFVSLIPLLAVPLAVLLSNTRRGWMETALLVLIAWNGLCFAQYRLGFVSMSQPLTIREMTVDRLLVPFRLLQKVLP